MNRQGDQQKWLTNQKAMGKDWWDWRKDNQGVIEGAKKFERTGK